MAMVFALLGIYIEDFPFVRWQVPQRQPGFLIKASDVEFLSPRKAEDAAQAVEDMSASEDAA